MDKLIEPGIDKNTIIVFTSDNGGMSAGNFGRPTRVIDPAKLDETYSTEKALYYERMAFVIEIPSVSNEIDGNLLSLTVGGVKAYRISICH